MPRPKTQPDIKALAREQFAGTLAIHPDYADAVANGNAPTAGYYDNDEDCPPYVRRGNVAIVSIRGALSQKGGYWWDGHEAIRGRIERALSDTNISAIVLEVNSPGGVVAGCWDNVRAVQRAKLIAKKPVFGFAREHAYSAGYAWTCVCDEFYLPESGGTASIGVLQILIDYSKMLDEAGVKAVVVRSGDRKARGNGWEALDEDTIADVQKTIDLLAEQFFALVADARGIAAAKLREYEGACFDGAKAVEKKLANGVLSWDAFLDKAEQAGRKYRMKTTAALLGLREDASEAEINAAIKTLQEKAATLDAVKAQNADTAVEFALRTGRITAGQKDQERATLIDSPINGTKALLARPEMGAIHQQTQETKVVNAGTAPPGAAQEHEFSAWAKLDAAALGRAYGNLIATDANGPSRLASVDPDLYKRASEAWRNNR